MSEQVTMSQKDVAQIEKYEHDDELCAKRVMIVGGEKLEVSIDSDKIASALASAIALNPIEKQESEHICKCEIKIVEVPAPFAIPATPQVITIKEPQVVIQHQVEKIEVPVIVKEYEKVEIPVIVKEACNCSASDAIIIQKEDKALKLILVAQIILTVVAILLK